MRPLSRTPVKLLRLLACVLTVSLAAGCGDACLSLAKQICQCLPDDGNRAACNQRAQQSEADIPVRAQDEAFCQKQIDAHACDCRVLNTPEGRVGCGQSFTTSKVLPTASGN